MDFVSWKCSWREGEEVEEDPSIVIGFLDGTNFWGAIVRKTMERMETTHTHSELRKERSNAWECMTM